MKTAAPSVELPEKAARGLLDAMPDWLVKTVGAAGMATLVLATGACEPTRGDDGFVRDENGNCIEQNSRRQERCLAAPNPNEDRQPHLTPLGEMLDAQTARGDYTWTTYNFNGTNWNLFNDGADYEGLKDTISLAALSPGEAGTNRDEASVACTLAALVIEARDPDLPISPVSMDPPQQIVNMVRGSAWTPLQLYQEGIRKFQEGVTNNEEPNAGHFQESADFCSFAGTWLFVGQPTYQTDHGSEPMQACGAPCLDNDLFPVPAGIKES